MEENKNIKIKNIYTWIFSAFTVIVAAVFLVHLWEIYRSAPRKAFTRAKIAGCFRDMAPILIVWLVALITNIVLHRFIPDAERKLKGTISPSVSLRNLKRKFVGGGKNIEGVRGTRIVRYTATAVGGILIALAMAWTVSVFLDKNYEPVRRGFFSAHGGVMDRMVTVFPWVMASILVGVMISYIWASEQKKELALLKSALATALRQKKEGVDVGGVLCAQGATWQSAREKWALYKEKHAKGFGIVKLSVRISLCVLAVVLIVVGIPAGGMDLVFEKARNICQQCIGLG